MILRPKPAPRHHATPAGSAIAAAVAAVPSWLRRAVPGTQTLAAQSFEEVAISAGAAIGALDAVVRRQERWAGAWRQRLALAAAAVTARQAGRVENEAALRDAVLLTRPGDDVGPAGRMLLAWRRLAGRPAEELLTEASIADVLEDLGHARDDTIGDLADELQQLAGGSGTVEMLTGAVAAAERHGFGRHVGAWFADALLAQRLGWAHAVPLLGTESALGMNPGPTRGASAVNAATRMEAGSHRGKNLLAGQARAALRNIDLFAELGRRADRLMAVTPKLRAKGAERVVEKLLSDDAAVASQPVGGMSDRGLRRLFDRLVELGAIRELSGRTTFRVYGL